VDALLKRQPGYRGVLEGLLDTVAHGADRAAPSESMSVAQRASTTTKVLSRSPGLMQERLYTVER